MGIWILRAGLNTGSTLHSMDLTLGLRYLMIISSDQEWFEFRALFVIISFGSSLVEFYFSIIDKFCVTRGTYESSQVQRSRRD